MKIFMTVLSNNHYSNIKQPVGKLIFKTNLCYIPERKKLLYNPLSNLIKNID